VEIDASLWPLGSVTGYASEGVDAVDGGDERFGSKPGAEDKVSRRTSDGGIV